MKDARIANNLTVKIVGVVLTGLLVVVLFWFILYNRNETQTQSPINQNENTDNTAQAPQLAPKPETKPTTVYANSDKLKVVEFVTDLDIPWDIAFTPEDVLLVNQRSGKLMARLADGTVQTVRADWSDLAVRAELGLMGMVVDPDFLSNRRFYTCQGDSRNKQVKVVSWRINDEYTKAERIDDPLVGDIPTAAIHVGCRLRFADDGYLWISTGDAAVGSNPQNINSLAGKVLRVDPATGQAASDNPFNESNKSRLVYSFGHRNPQGLAWNSQTKQMWAVEHGPDVDDEINLLIKSGNYGWDPVSSSNKYYQQVPMTDKQKHVEAIEAKWSSGNSTLATSGAIFLEGDRWGDKEGWLAVATLKDKNLYLFQFDPTGNLQNHIKVDELDGKYGRLRSPLIGPDGSLYLTTSNGKGKDFVLKVFPD